MCNEEKKNSSGRPNLKIGLKVNGKIFYLVMSYFCNILFIAIVNAFFTFVLLATNPLITTDAQILNPNPKIWLQKSNRTEKETAFKVFLVQQLLLGESFTSLLNFATFRFFNVSFFIFERTSMIA